MSKEILDSLRLTIGPLHYEFVAHDKWSSKAIDKMRNYIVCHGFDCDADRILHMAHMTWTLQANKQHKTGLLLDQFLALLPPHTPHDHWRIKGDGNLHLSFLHDKTNHGLFVFGAKRGFDFNPFQLPWHAIFNDIVLRNGGIVHGGLVVKNSEGLIITAPPGGGKTTAISRIPDSWTVLADDACLVWPDQSGQFLASPLPTWSVLMDRTTILQNIGKWRLSNQVNISKIILLIKAEKEKIELIEPLKGLHFVFQALCEYPWIAKNGRERRGQLFELTLKLAKKIPLFNLYITLGGRWWELLD